MDPTESRVCPGLDTFFMDDTDCNYFAIRIEEVAIHMAVGVVHLSLYGDLGVVSNDDHDHDDNGKSNIRMRLDLLKPLFEVSAVSVVAPDKCAVPMKKLKNLISFVAVDWSVVVQQKTGYYYDYYFIAIAALHQKKQLVS
jgi:hypothetical protein